MLDLFRRRKGGLKWVLWLVIVVLGAGMLLFFVQTPGGIGTEDPTSSLSPFLNLGDFRRDANDNPGTQ